MMNVISKLMKYLTDKQFRFNINSKYGFHDNMSDEDFLRRLYSLNVGGRPLNLENPKTFNEKLNWLKIHDRNPLFTRLADKYLVKDFVADAIGKQYVVKNLAVYDSVEEIDWDTLPDKFVIKATHDSSGACICKDKAQFDIKSFQKKYKKIMKRDYYRQGREWPYKNIKPRIIVDELLEDDTAESANITLRDYKFWCFHGEPKYMYCTVKDTDIFENFYDMSFHPVDINHGFCRHDPEFDKPENFELMVQLAGTLAKKSEAKFVRIDFFNVHGRIYFGEFTFYDWGGLRPFKNIETDEMLGTLIDLGNHGIGSNE